MNKICGLFSWFISDDGQTLIEYMLVLVLMAVVMIIILTGMGETTSNTYSEINSALPM